MDKLNLALAPYPDLAEKPIEDLLKDLSQVPEQIRVTVKNTGRGHYNHSLFWEIMAPASQNKEKPTFVVYAKKMQTQNLHIC